VSVVELPHARLAGGPRTLLVLEGLTLENKAPTGRALRLLRWAYKRFTRDYTIYQVARRRGLPADATTRALAGDHARWARGRFAGPVDVAAHMDFGRLGGGLVRLLGKRMMKEPGDASDHIATLEADLAHDATEALPQINAPTLVIAGTRDFFYPEPILRATAERIPDATLRLYDGVGHPVGKTHKRRFEDDVSAFLNG
jgi:pimeloyl-ACP methyl ester carboxylesterase